MDDRMQNYVLFSKSDAIADLPNLRLWSNKLLVEVIDPCLRQKEINITKDAFRLLCLSFIARQLNHAQSLVALKHNRDMSLIARTMLEGLALLLWVRKDPIKRSENWRNFSFIHDWRLLKKHRESGIQIDEEVWKRAEAACLEFGSNQYTIQAIKAKERNEKLPNDPYWKYWTSQTKVNWRVIFEEAGISDWYDQFYVGLCNWFHWECSSLAVSIEHSADGYSFNPINEEDEYYSILISIFSILFTMEIVDKEIGTNINDELQKFKKDFESWLITKGNKIKLPIIAK
jgi:hypothetical protein